MTCSYEITKHLNYRKIQKASQVQRLTLQVRFSLTKEWREVERKSMVLRVERDILLLFDILILNNYIIKSNINIFY